MPLQKISKQDVIITIKNVESSLISLDINNDLKNETREKVTNKYNSHNFNKESCWFVGINHGFNVYP